MFNRYLPSILSTFSENNRVPHAQDVGGDTLLGECVMDLKCNGVNVGQLYINGGFSGSVHHNTSQTSNLNISGHTNNTIVFNTVQSNILNIVGGLNLTNTHLLNSGAKLQILGNSGFTNIFNLIQGGQLNISGNTDFTNIFNLTQNGLKTVLGNISMTNVYNTTHSNILRLNSNISLSTALNLSNLYRLILAGRSDPQIILNLVGDLEQVVVLNVDIFNLLLNLELLHEMNRSIHLTEELSRNLVTVKTYNIER